MSRYPCVVEGCTATVPTPGLCPWHQVNGTPDQIVCLKHLKTKQK